MSENKTQNKTEDSDAHSVGFSELLTRFSEILKDAADLEDRQINADNNQVRVTKADMHRQGRDLMRSAKEVFDEMFLS